MMIYMLANTLPRVMLAVWVTIAEAGPVGTYGTTEFTAYYLARLLVRQMTSVWVAWDLDYDIRMGELSPKLLRPMDPIHNHLALIQIRVESGVEGSGGEPNQLIDITQ
jgi:ABC-2 type transport system permease protein